MAMATERVLSHETHGQDTSYWCGPASTRTLLSIHGIVVAEGELAREMGTTTEGTMRAAIVAALNRRLGAGRHASVAIPGDLATDIEAAALQDAMVRSIDAGHGIIANVVGSATDVTGSYHSYTGHYVAVVGYRSSGDEALVSDVGINRDYWMTTRRLANWCARRGYVHAAGNDGEGDDMALTDEDVERIAHRVLGDGGVQQLLHRVLAMVEDRASVAMPSGATIENRLRARMVATQTSLASALNELDRVHATLDAILARLSALELGGGAPPGVDEIAQATASAVAAKLAERLAA